METILLKVEDMYIRISYGDGTNSDSLVDGCDEYLYIEMGINKDNLELAGQLDYNSEVESYLEDILTTIPDVLDFFNLADKAYTIIEE